MKKILLVLLTTISISVAARADMMSLTNMYQRVVWYSDAVLGMLNNSGISNEQITKFMNGIHDMTGGKVLKFSMAEFLDLCMGILNDKTRCVDMGMDLAKRHNEIFDKKHFGEANDKKTLGKIIDAFESYALTVYQNGNAYQFCETVKDPLQRKPNYFQSGCDANGDNTFNCTNVHVFNSGMICSINCPRVTWSNEKISPNENCHSIN